MTTQFTALTKSSGETVRLDLRGNWNATTNTPTLASGTGTIGQAYRVSVAGSTTLDGISSWLVDDFVYFDGSVWLKDDHNTAVGGGGGGISNVVEDTTPQLGGDLDTNGFNIDGRDIAADGTKLDGIEAGADVTDTVNVDAAGAVMESDYTAKGVLLVATGVGVPVALPPSTDGLVLTLDSVEASGVKWAAGGGGGGITSVIEDTTPQLGGDLDTNGFNIDGRDIAVDGAKLDTTVVGPAVVADNAICRFDGTTGKLIQTSAVAIDDSGNITTSGTVDGVDVSALAAAVVAHTGDTANPHATDLGNLGTGTLAELNAVLTDATLSEVTAANIITALESAATDIDLNNQNITGVGTVDGRDLSVDGAKLDGIEAGADVTDATNVNAAGAVMESDYTAKGVILVASGAGTPVAETVGTDGQGLVADSGQTSGVVWEPKSKRVTGQWHSPGAFPILEGGDDVNEFWKVPYDITVTGISFTPISVAPSGGANTLAVLNLTAAVSLLVGATVSIDGGTSYTPTPCTLSGTPANLALDAGEIVAITVHTGAGAAGYGVLVEITYERR